MKTKDTVTLGRRNKVKGREERGKQEVSSEKQRKQEMRSFLRKCATTGKCNKL